MTRDFSSEFPIPTHLLPPKLLELLSPASMGATKMVDVSARFDSDRQGMEDPEHAYSLMVAVPEGAAIDQLQVLRGTMLVAESTPVIRNKGNSDKFNPTVLGNDYIIASWGDGSSYTYNLSEKVWMALGLTPRCIGNHEQRLVYDDLSIPVFNVAEGEVSAELLWSSSRNIVWRMRNDYLRDYLWMRGASGIRTFYYQGPMEDGAAVEALMAGKSRICIGKKDDWFEVDLGRFEGKLVLQVWAAVVAVSCERCDTPSAEGLVWPGIPEPVTRARANAELAGPIVYLDDTFLERYEQNLYYSSVPNHYYGSWHCNPAYRGQWAFSDCRRIGRNLIKVRLRELFKVNVDSELLHARVFAIPANAAEAQDLQEEHIVEKTHRLLMQLLNLGENLAKLGDVVGIQKSASEWVGFDKAKLEYSGWAAYSQLARLAQVAPLTMTQQAFLSRCKSLHEIWQRIPDGLLRQILRKAGIPKAKVDGLKSLKLLEALLNVTQRLDAQQEQADALLSQSEPEGWDVRNPNMTPLFLNNDLRIADAHEAVGSAIKTLEKLGFDIASLNTGYGRALDFVFDGVIKAFDSLNQAISGLLGR